MKKLFWFGTALAAFLLMTACQNALSPGAGGRSSSQSGSRAVVDGFGNTYLLPYSPYNYEVLESRFVPAATGGISQVIKSDKTLNEPVWTGTPQATINKYTSLDGTSAPALGYSTTGYMRSVWDGYTLYVAVEVRDNTPDYLTAVTNSTTRFVTDTSTNLDCVEFYIDFFNHKTDKWELEMGRAKVSRNGKLVGHQLDSNATGTWADPFSQMNAREFTDRVKDWGAYEVTNGYIAWIALELWAGADPKNGISVGLDVAIADGPTSTTGAAATGRTYWSHDYTTGYWNAGDGLWTPRGTRGKDGNLDWGAIVLTGHTGADNSDFSNSDWMLTNPIRWAKGDPWWPGTGTYNTDTAGAWLINLPDTVESSWTPESWTRLQNAIEEGKDVLTEADIWGRPHVDWGTTTQAEVKTLAQNVEAAIVTLRWADDPLGATQFDAEPLNTLPDPLRFKTDGVFPDGTYIPGLSGRKGTYVQNEADWKLRAREIKALAAIYEYGPVPDAPSIHDVTVQVSPPVPEHWELPPWWVVNGVATKVPASLPGSVTITATYTYTGAEGASWDGTPDTKIPGFSAVAGSASNSYTITFPTATEKAVGGITGGVPVMVHFTDGGATTHRSMGIASLGIPDSVTSDDRNNTVWQTRSGTFRTFFPYQGRGQRYEISNEMAAAWAASRAIDALVDAGTKPIYDNGIQISNISSSADFKLGDRLSHDGVTWWTVGYLDAADNSVAQMGPAAIRRLYLETGAIPPTSGGDIVFNQFLTFIANGQYDEVQRGSATATVTVGTSQPMDYTVADIVDHTKIGTAGFSINGKYAFVAGVYDDRVGVTIPGAAGATGPQPWRYDSKGNEYGWGSTLTGWLPSDWPSQAGTELLADNVLHNPGRANEVIRRFLNHFKWYEYLRGIDANGDISHGYGERLPFDNHELVAALYPRAAILRNTQRDFADGGDGDAIGFQAALMVYRRLIEQGWGAHATKAGYSAAADQLINFNYRMLAGVTGDPHGADAIQYTREAAYMAWYFYNNPFNAGYASHFKFDPMLNDVLVPGGSNAYDRHYGGLKTMMPWPWAGPYYSTR